MIHRSRRARFARSLALALALLPGAAPGLSAQLEPPRRDEQLRPELSISWSAHPRVDLVGASQLHVGRWAGRVVQNRTGLTAQWRALPGATLAAGYQHLRGRPTGTRAAREHRPTAALTLRTPTRSGFSLADRNQVELRYREGQRSTRYRNRLTLERDLPRGRRVYLADEVFYDSRYDDWVRNQLSLGAGGEIRDGLGVDLYLMRQDDARARPGDLLIVGLVLRARL